MNFKSKEIFTNLLNILEEMTSSDRKGKGKKKEELGGGEGVMGRFKGKKTGLRGDKGKEGKSGRTRRLDGA